MQKTLRASLVVFAAGLLPASALAQSCNSTDRSVLLILDASGSMNAKLPNGETRIAVAQRAIKGVAEFVPAQAQLSLRMYGAQSPAREKNCQDTNLAVPFGAASAAGGAIATSVDAAKAQGYTPIAYSLGEAANDFPADAKERVIVLVSDGKETCQGDPVLAAKALAANNITVHTVGFIVDTAARGQLQNIARITGGTYFDAPVGPELPDTLKKAFDACKQRAVTIPPNPKPGKLSTTSAIVPLKVFESESGKAVGQLDRATMQMELPAGTYEVRFGKAIWPFVKIDGGKTLTLKPAMVKIDRSVKWQKRARVVTKDGAEVFRFDAVSHRISLPPGEYVVEIDDNKIPFNGTEGEVLDVKPQ